MTDVFVVGGSLAGLALAIAARARGFRVVVADCARPPIDKSCGEGMLPETVEALGALGVSLPDAADSHPLRGIRFRGAQATVDALFPRGEGLGVRRTILHQLLIDRAAALGVEMRWGVRIGGLEEIRARWIIGADGQGSRVRRWAGLDECVRESRRYGFRRRYRAVPWTDRVEVHWGRECQVYVTPVSPSEVCVALLTRDPHIRVADMQAQFPRLKTRLAGASTEANERGAVSATRQLRRVWRGNVALVGDASGSVDAITGEGMCLAFRQALRLAEALASGGLNSYQRWHKRAMGRPAFMADLLLLLDRFPGLRELALRALESWPGSFSRLVAFHTEGEAPAICGGGPIWWRAERGEWRAFRLLSGETARPRPSIAGPVAMRTSRGGGECPSPACPRGRT